MTPPAETTKIELELREELARLRTLLPERIDLDPADLERGLAGLVLTLVEFLRQVLERQAIRRMEGGTLSDDEVERVGLALMRLQEKIREIAQQFGLDEDDIQLRIGAAS
jgi:predicted Zn-dependent protease with MMP-like domain